MSFLTLLAFTQNLLHYVEVVLTYLIPQENSNHWFFHQHLQCCYNTVLNYFYFHGSSINTIFLKKHDKLIIPIAIHK